MDSHVFVIALEVSGLWFFSYIYQKQPNEMKWLEEDIECEINEQSLSAGLNAVTLKRAFCGLTKCFPFKHSEPFHMYDV